MKYRGTSNEAEQPAIQERHEQYTGHAPPAAAATVAFPTACTRATRLQPLLHCTCATQGSELPMAQPYAYRHKRAGKQGPWQAMLQDLATVH